jgi:hypothetical protein
MLACFHCMVRPNKPVNAKNKGVGHHELAKTKERKRLADDEGDWTHTPRPHTQVTKTPWYNPCSLARAVMGLTFFGLRKAGSGRCSSLPRFASFGPPPQAWSRGLVTSQIDFPSSLKVSSQRPDRLSCPLRNAHLTHLPSGCRGATASSVRWHTEHTAGRLVQLVNGSQQTQMGNFTGPRWNWWCHLGYAWL